MEPNKKLHKLLTSDMANKLFNLILGVTFIWFVAKNIAVMAAFGFKYSTFMFVIFNSVVVILSFIRHAPKVASTSPKDYIVAIAGTFIALLFAGTEDSQEYVIVNILQLIGFFISFIGILYLRRSFGIVPANRGIVTNGIYAYIRHPLYAGYLLQFICTVIQNFSITNIIVLIAASGFEIWRLTLEENLLARDKEYKAYLKKVKWRILPYVW